MKRTTDAAKILQSFRFSGRSTGAVKTLRGFKKSHHSVPDAVNPATAGFLAKIASEELAEEAERYFQQARTLLQYKRKDLALDVGNGAAVLSAKDFTYEIEYSLSEYDPAEYAIARSLHSVKSQDFLLTAECDQLFAGLFSELVFGLQKGAPVERVIDAVEGLNSEDFDLKVDYPSDCRQCVITVPDVAAEVRFDGGTLTVAFPKTQTPRELWQSFLSVRTAFSLSKDAILAGLVGG